MEEMKIASRGLIGTCNPYYMGYMDSLEFKPDWQWEDYIEWLKEHEQDFEVNYFCKTEEWR